MGRSEFLNRYNISAESFSTAGISWDELEAIRTHYLQTRDELEPTARSIVNILHKTDKVHSVSYRIKEPEHLLAKIIRKRIGKPAQIVNFDNYQQEITDLIGIRVLHLFKEDWREIHSFIIRSWNLRKAAVAYVRRGDAAGYINSFKTNGCQIKEHPYGYRSVHYLLKSNIAGKEQISEVQIRTLFEEAWSSIDHHVRYPYEPRNVLLNELLVILNRLAGSADELGSYIIYLKKKLKTMNDSSSSDELRDGKAGAVFQLLDDFDWPAEMGGAEPKATAEGEEPDSSQVLKQDGWAEGPEDSGKL